LLGDWSSDVCSSDLLPHASGDWPHEHHLHLRHAAHRHQRAADAARARFFEGLSVGEGEPERP